MNKRERAKIAFESLCNDHGIELIDSYLDATTPISIRCSCGHIAKKRPTVIKRALQNSGVVNCRDCQYQKNSAKRKHKDQEVFDFLKKHTHTVLSDTYQNVDSKMSFVCDCGDYFERSLYLAKESVKKHGRNICNKCAKKKTKPSNALSKQQIEEIFKAYDAKIISEYSNSKDKIEYIGSCGHKSERRWNDIQQSIKNYGKILCTQCGKAENRSIYKTSTGEDEVAEYIESLGFSVTRNKRPEWTQGLEIDIMIDGTNIAIEYCGEYWHSEEAGKDKDYHSKKDNLAAMAGINLLHIFETEWIYQKDIIKSMISARLGKSKTVYARKTSVKKITAKEARDFFDATHRQGGKGSTHISYGLFLGEELIAAMSFRKSRFDTQYDYELYRFSTKLYTSVVGGFQKLFSAFKKEYQDISVVSYADLRFSSISNNIYLRSGFSFAKGTKPGYMYFKQGMPLQNRIGYQKHKLKQRLKTFNPELTEYENMKANGFLRVWDCGHGVFVSRT